jgi:hypothetical protein
MTRIVNYVLRMVYPALVFGGVVLAWDLSGQAELAHHHLPPLGDGYIPLKPTLSLRSSCEQKEHKNVPIGKSCSVRTEDANAE